jgi:hypothetical protein
MNTLNNSASRLHAILSAAFSHNPDAKIQNVWQELFKLKENELYKISLIQPRLIKLANEVGEQIESISHLQKKSIYLKCVNQISEALYKLGHVHSVRQLHQEINDNLLDSLHICSDLLTSNNISEISLGDDKLEELNKEVDLLLNQIGELNLDIEFKKTLLSIVLELKYAIDYYRIHGYEGFRVYTERFLGDLLLNKSNFESMKNKSDTKEAFAGIFRIFDQTNKLVEFAKNTKLALPFVKEFIEKLT